MKKMNLLVVLMYLTTNTMFAQSNDNEIILIPPSSGKVNIEFQSLNNNFSEWEEINLVPTNANTQVFDSYSDNVENQIKAGISVKLGVNFGANNLADGTPMDNTLAISNGGFIISADNRGVDYYNDSGDTIVQFTNKYSDFYNNSGFSLKNVFDPRVIYDRYNDRFILVTIDHRKDTTSCIYVSFSKNNTPSDTMSWNHYLLPIDSTHYDTTKVYWYDYINIAINKTELYITPNVLEYSGATGSSTFVGNVLWRIEKQTGYDSLSLVCMKNSDIMRPNSTEKVFTLVPLCESLQSDSYNKGCLLVANKSRYVTNNELYWFHLTGNITSPSTTINSNFITTTSYSRVPYASQPGGNGGDRISVGNCRIRSGYYQNGKIHAVYTISNLDWGQIVYTVIDTASNTENRHTWGITNKNYLYPSIASFSNDTITEDAMICFLRCGPTIYPEVCVVNYNNGWSSSSKVVKGGVDIVNLQNDIVTPWDTLERLGDYTSIQRKYNEPACWLVGSYAYGSTPNLGLISNGLNAWISEVGDLGVGIKENNKSKYYSVYPNPVKSGGIINIKSENPQEITSVILFSLNGQKIKGVELLSNSEIRVPKINKGFYLLKIITKTGNYETIKILVD